MIKAAFIPEPLRAFHKLWYMDIEDVTGKPIQPDVVFNWNWTGTRWQDYYWHPDYKVVNEKCLCTEKSYVDKIFTQIYGYSSEYTGRGWCVEKNDATNGRKEAVLVRMDEERQEGRFYQKALFNLRAQKVDFTEYRIVIMGFEPMMCVKKEKTITVGDLIGKINNYEFCDIPDSKIGEFCKAYPLEYGEIDSCFYDGKYWIFDVNPTPGDAMFHRMPEKQAGEFKETYKRLFNEWMEVLCS